MKNRTSKGRRPKPTPTRAYSFNASSARSSWPRSRACRRACARAEWRFGMLMTSWWDRCSPGSASLPLIGFNLDELVERHLGRAISSDGSLGNSLLEFPPRIDVGRSSELHASYRSLHRGPFIFGPAFFAAEKLLRVPDSRAHQTSLARRCSGHDALPADCKCPKPPTTART